MRDRRLPSNAPSRARCDSQPTRRMAEISNTSGVVTLINVFTVDPENQQRLIDLLVRATDGLVDRAPGFMSATLHRSLDGKKVTMYAQWRSAEDYQAMRQDPGPRPFLEEALTSRRSNRVCMKSCRRFCQSKVRPVGASLSNAKLAGTTGLDNANIGDLWSHRCATSRTLHRS